jgi:hypothetical protein
VQLRTDLAVVVGGDMVCVDVVVTNPASASYIENRRRVPQEPQKLEVAAMAERVKQYKYRAAYNSNNHLKHIADNLVPFAVEATGTLGDKASKFVYGLAKLQGAIPEADPRIGWARRFFLNRVSVLCAKARAELVMLSQKTQRPDARRAQPLEVSLQGDLEFEQILYDNLLGPPVRPSQASAHSNRSE